MITQNADHTFKDQCYISLDMILAYEMDLRQGWDVDQ